MQRTEGNGISSVDRPSSCLCSHVIQITGDWKGGVGPNDR